MVALSTIGRQFRRSRSGSETASSWHQKGRDLEAHAGSKIKTSRETNTWLYQMLPWAPCNKPAQTTHHPRIPACRFLSGCQSASDQLSKRLTLPSPGISYFLGSMKQAGKTSPMAQVVRSFFTIRSSNMLINRLSLASNTLKTGLIFAGHFRALNSDVQP